MYITTTTNLQPQQPRTYQTYPLRIPVLLFDVVVIPNIPVAVTQQHNIAPADPSFRQHTKVTENFLLSPCCVGHHNKGACWHDMCVCIVDPII